MNIHKSQLFWCELQGYKVLTHCQMIYYKNTSSPMFSPHKTTTIPGVEASASGAFGWVLPVEQHRFLRLLKLQAAVGKATDVGDSHGESPRKWSRNGGYPLANIQKAIEHVPYSEFSHEKLWYMMIFHSDVSLPEGKCGFFHMWKRHN